MKILLLEPHGDDALLSCSSILETNNDIDLLTFSDRSSEKLCEYYKSIKNYEFCNIKSLWLLSGRLLNSHEVHKFYKNNANLYEYLNDTIVNNIRKNNYNRSYYDAMVDIKNIIKNKLINNKYDIVVCCAGLSDSYHIAVRYSLIKVNEEFNIPIIYYADKFYIQNRYCKEIYENFVKELNLCEYNSGYNPLEKENTKIKEILYEVYPSEVKLLRFYSNIILWYPCKYAYKSNNLVERLIGDLNGS